MVWARDCPLGRVSPKLMRMICVPPSREMGRGSQDQVPDHSRMGGQVLCVAVDPSIGFLHRARLLLCAIPPTGANVSQHRAIVGPVPLRQSVRRARRPSIHVHPRCPTLSHAKKKNLGSSQSSPRVLVFSHHPPAPMRSEVPIFFFHFSRNG